MWPRSETGLGVPQSSIACWDGTRLRASLNTRSSTHQRAKSSDWMQRGGYWHHRTGRHPDTKQGVRARALAPVSFRERQLILDQSQFDTKRAYVATHTE